MKKLIRNCLAGACLLALGACASESPQTTTTTTTTERSQTSAKMRDPSAQVNQSDANRAMDGPPR